MLAENSIRKFSDFQISNDDQHGSVWMVDRETQNAYINQTALSMLCEAEPHAISNIMKTPPKELKASIEKALNNITRIENPNGGKPYFGIPSDLASDILCYYAFIARGHENRQLAKHNVQIINKGGMKLFIMAQAGFTVKAKHVDDIEPISEHLGLLPEIDEKVDDIDDSLKRIEEALIKLQQDKKRLLERRQRDASILSRFGRDGLVKIPVTFTIASEVRVLAAQAEQQGLSPNALILKVVQKWIRNISLD